MRNFFKNKTNLLLTFIIFFAAFLRLYRIADYMTFLGDEGRDVLVVYNILHGHFTLLGPTASVGGFYFGPLYYYMMAPFLWLFNYNPVGPAIMVALFGTATVWLVYKIGSEFFNRPVGLIAAFFYTISPLVISFSRSSWNPNPVPFFSLLTIYFLYRGSITSKENYSPHTWVKTWEWFLVCGIALGVAIELHFINFFLGAVVAVFVLLKSLFLEKYKNRIAIVKQVIQEYFFIFIGFLTGQLPYLGFEIRHKFSNTRSIINFIFHSKDTGGNSHFFQTIGDVFFRLFGHLVTNFPTPDRITWFNGSIIYAWAAFTILIAFLGITTILLQFYQTKPHSLRQMQLFLMTIWFVIGILLFGFYKKQIYDYYFTFIFPLPFLFVSNLLYLLWKKNMFVLKISVAVVFISLSALSLQGVPFRYEPNRQLFQTETISKFVLSKTGNKPFNFALITGSNSDHAYRYFFTIWGHPPTMIENITNDPKRKSVTDQLLIVCESLPCYPLGNPLFEVAGFGRGEIVGHWKISVVEIYQLGHYKGK